MSEPFSFINRQTQTYASVRVAVAQAGHPMAKFDVLNAHIRNAVVLPGELIIISDDTSTSCTGQEAYLMRKAAEVHVALAVNGMQGDGYLIENYDFLQDVLAKTSLGVGSATEGWSRHLDSIKHSLEDIQRLHREYKSSSSPHARDAFFQKRRLAFAKLNQQLKSYASAGAGLRSNSSIKRMLGISTKSFAKTGEIDGYAARIAGVSKASLIIKRAGFIGVGLEIASTRLEIAEACSMGNNGACKKAWFVEGAKLVGALGGGAVGGKLGGAVATAGCSIVLGVATGGPRALACFVVGGAIGGLAVGDGGSALGGKVGEVIYEAYSE